MDGRLPLPTLLSHALVAFTIEFDNEFEHRTPHRTTTHGSTGGSRDAPWLVSMVMWTKFLQFVDDEGVTLRELRRRTGASAKEMRTWLTRLSEWWGYVVVEPEAEGSDSMVRPTAGGRRALAVWRPLTGAIEKRWEERFGVIKVGNLRESLDAIDSQLDAALPASLPILGYGLFSRGTGEKQAAIYGRSLPARLSRVLLAFAIAFERDSGISLAIGANVLRLVGEQGVRLSDLPRLAAVSREAIAMSLSFLGSHGYAAVGPESPGSRVKLVRLTSKGQDARLVYLNSIWRIEEDWRARFGEQTLVSLRQSLEALAGEVAAPDPYPDGWRASVPTPEGLPHYPMILHRGGFPDGS
jgi:DNA-binding PadR family transcriptional regulator